MRKIPGGRKLTRSRLKKKRAKFIKARQSQHIDGLLGFMKSGFDAGKNWVKAVYGDKPVSDEAAFAVMNQDHGYTDTSIPELRLALLANFTSRNGLKEEVLRSRRDTTFSMNDFAYRTILEENGFVKVLEEEFIDDTWANEGPVKEKCFVYFREPGQVLFFDTYRGSRNSGSLYFNWKPNADCDRRNLPSFSSSTTESGITLGHIDCREGLMLSMKLLQDNGTLLPEWVEGSHIWFVNFVESKKSGDLRYPRSSLYFDSISLKRIKRLPEHVQACMIKQVEYLEKHIADAKVKLQLELAHG